MEYAQTNVTREVAVDLLLHEPFWAELYYSFYVYEMPSGFNNPFPDTLATDELNLWISHEFWKTLPKTLRKSALVHEIVHKMYHHGTRRGNRDPVRWNVVCDESVNELLVDNGFPIGADWVQPVPARHGWSAERRYDALTQEQEAQGGASKPAPEGMFRDVKDVTTASAEAVRRHEEVVEQAVERALLSAKAAGRVPKGVEKELRRIYEPAEEPWFNNLHRYMQELAPSQYSWARFDRRTLITHGIFAPSRCSEALGPVVFGRDTSGSMDTASVQHRLMAHVQAIMAEAKPRTLTMLDFDAAIQQVSDFLRNDDDIHAKHIGGGGTDFCPVFKWIDDNMPNPAVLIMATDLEGRFPTHAPDYPVVWASINPRLTAPFGSTIYVK